MDTTQAADADGLRWLKTDAYNKLSDYSFVQMTVKFSAFNDTYATHVSTGCAIYKYSFGFDYKDIKFFFDNTYVSGSFGGGILSNGDALGTCYVSIYNITGKTILNALTASGWTSYTDGRLATDTEYIFLFDVKSMGDTFTLAGFDGAEIYDIKWLTTAEIIIPEQPHVHDFKTIEEVPATYLATGVKAHYECNDCGKIYVLVEGEYVETAAEDLVIAKLVEAEQADTSVGILYQNGLHAKTNEAGKYVVDTTQKTGEGGFYWLTTDAANKLEEYSYLKMTVKFASFNNTNAAYASSGCSIYKYSFGFNYADVRFFFDNTYAGGGFGGACGPDGSANRNNYLSIYATNGDVVLNAMNAVGWTSYATLSLDTEYVFIFNVKAMGDSFTLAGFQGAEISNVKWQKTANINEQNVEEQADKSVGRLYQDGKEIKAVDGVYSVDKSASTGAAGLHWLTVDSEKTSDYTYLKMTVKFSAFNNTNAAYASSGCSIYKYSFGFNYSDVKFFFDNTYAGGGFGGGCGPDGSANRNCYFSIYTTDGKCVLDAMNASGWTAYATLSLDTEYVFVFNVKAMGDSFTLAGFDDAQITQLKWTNEI